MNTFLLKARNICRQIKIKKEEEKKDKYLQHKQKFLEEKRKKDMTCNFNPSLEDEYQENYQKKNQPVKQEEQENAAVANYNSTQEKDNDKKYFQNLHEKYKSLDLERIQYNLEKKVDKDYQQFKKLSESQNKFYKKIHKNQYVSQFKNKDILQIQQQTTKQLKKIKNKEEIETINNMTQKIIQDNNRQLKNIISKSTKQLQSSKQHLKRNDIENIDLNEQLLNLKQKVADLEQKNVDIVQEYKSQKDYFKQISQFMPFYQEFKEKFGNSSLASIYDRIINLENICRKQTQEHIELLDDKRQLENQLKQKLKEHQSELLIAQNINRKRKEEEINFQFNNQDLVNEVRQQKKQIEYYQSEYLQLTNEITQIYNKIKPIHQQFQSDYEQNEPHTYSPQQMLNFIKDLLNISTPDAYFQQIRKINVSANMLLRKQFPAKIYSQFQNKPHLIFDTINQQFNTLNIKINNLQHQINQFNTTNVKDKIKKTNNNNSSNFNNQLCNIQNNNNENVNFNCNYDNDPINDNLDFQDLQNDYNIKHKSGLKQQYNRANSAQQFNQYIQKNTIKSVKFF